MSLSRNKKDVLTNYVSLLRIDSKIGSLIEHKRGLKSMREGEEKNQRQKKQILSRNTRSLSVNHNNHHQAQDRQTKAQQLQPVMQHAYTATQQKAIGFGKVDRSSARLNKPGMINGSNARILENRFFLTKASPRGSHLTIATSDPKGPSLQLQTKSPTLKAYHDYVDKQLKLKVDESVQQILDINTTPFIKSNNGNLRTITPSKKSTNTTILRVTDRLNGNESEPNIIMPTQQQTFRNSQQDSTSSLVEIQSTSQAQSSSIYKNSTGAALLPSIFSSVTLTQKGETGSWRRASLPDISSSQFAPQDQSFDQNSHLRLVQKKFSAFQARAQSVLVSQTSIITPEEQAQLQGSPSSLLKLRQLGRKNIIASDQSSRKSFHIVGLSPRRHQSCIEGVPESESKINLRASLAQIQGSLVSKMTQVGNMRKVQIQEKVKEGILRRKKEDALNLRRKLNPDEEFQEEWNSRLLVAEYNIASAMQSVDQQNEIDYSVDVNLQLSKNYKRKLAEANGHLLNQIYSQTGEIQQNVKALEYQNELIAENKKRDKSFIDIKRIYLRLKDKEALQRAAKKLAKKTKAIQQLDASSVDQSSIESPTPRFRQNNIIVPNVKIEQLSPEDIIKINIKPVMQLSQPQQEEMEESIFEMRSSGPIQITRLFQTIKSSKEGEENISVSRHNTDVNVNLLQDDGSKKHSGNLLEIDRISSKFIFEHDTSLSQIGHKFSSRLALGESIRGIKTNINRDKEVSQINLNFERVKTHKQSHNQGEVSSASSFASSSDTSIQRSISRARESEFKSNRSSSQSSAEGALKRVNFGQRQVRLTAHQSRKKQIQNRDQGESSVSMYSHKFSQDELLAVSSMTQVERETQGEVQEEKQIEVWQEEYLIKEKENDLRPKLRDLVLQYYHLDNKSVKKFLSFCMITQNIQDKKDDQVVNGYPILHQLFYGRLILVNCDYQEQWRKCIQHVIAILKEPEIDIPLDIVYIESCTIEDKVLAQILEVLGQSSLLKEIHLVKMKLGVFSTLAILRHLKHKPNLNFSFRQSTFTYTDQQQIITRTGQIMHPILSKLLVPIKHLSLVSVDLADVHIESVINRLNQLEALNLGFNRFSPDFLLNFILAINRVNNNELSLRNLSLAGNSLQTSSERQLAQAMVELLLKRALVHLDLSQCELQPFVVQRMTEALRYARTLQSLHLSAPDVREYARIAKKAIGPFLFSNNTTKHADSFEFEDEEIPLDWNNSRKLPDPNTDPIQSKLLHSMSVQPLNKGRQNNKMILSRILGRSKDLNLQVDMQNVKSSEDKIVNLDSLLNEEQTLDKLEGLCSVQDYAWLMSDRCWICERWAYYLPLFTKEEIEDCQYDENLSQVKNLAKLGPVQERAFDGLVKLHSEKFKKFGIGVPYIIGALTNYEFVEMGLFGDYIFSIDPDAQHVRDQSQNRINSVETHIIYCEKWQKVLKKSSKFNVQDHKRRQTEFKAYTTAPYEVIIDRPLDETFGKFDNVWVQPLLVPPGPFSYFFYYRFDETQELRAQVHSQVPMRDARTHFYALPKSRHIPEHLVPKSNKEKNKQLKRGQVIDKFFTIFRTWKYQTSQKVRETVLHVDCELWQRLRLHPRIIGLLHSMSSTQQNGKEKTERLDIKERRYRMGIIIERIETALKEHILLLDQVYKHLQTGSDAYPLLNWKTILNFFQTLGFIDEHYSIFKLKIDYIETYSLDKKIKKDLSAQKLDIQGANIMSNVSKMKNVVGLKSTVNKFKTTAMREKEQQQLLDNKKDPQNLLSRLHFYELIVRISIQKYSLLQPNECIKRFVCEYLKPGLTTRELRGALEPLKILDQLFFSNENVKELFFLNQFSLKKIYDQLAREDPTNIALKEEKRKVKKNKMTRLQKQQSQQQQQTSSQKNIEIKLSDDSDDRKIDSHTAKSLRDHGQKEESKDEMVQKFNETNGILNIKLELPTSKEKLVMLSIPEQHSPLHSTGFRKRALSMIVPNNEALMALRKNKNKSEWTLAQRSPRKSDASSVKSKKSSHSSKMRRNKISFTSKAKEAADTEAVQHTQKKKKKNVPKYLEDFTQITYEHLRLSLTQTLGSRYSTKFTPAVFKYCHTWAKISTQLVRSQLRILKPQNLDKNNNSVDILAMLEAQQKQEMRITFVEVCIFLCLLTWQLYDDIKLLIPSVAAKQVELSDAQDQAFDSLQSLMEFIMQAFDLSFQKELDEQTLSGMKSIFRKDQNDEKGEDLGQLSEGTQTQIQGFLNNLSESTSQWYDDGK